MTLIELPEADSTNLWLAQNRTTLTPPTLVYALNQTAGRGQRGNSWESEPGKNLTASALLDPVGILPREQFYISEAVALAVVDLLAGYGVDARVKWPNDIYVGDRKICGILIEHAILPDSIMYTIAGIGVNINQTRFLSDAPNPVSLLQLTPPPDAVAGPAPTPVYDIPEAAARLASRLEVRLSQILSPGSQILSPGSCRDAIHSVRRVSRAESEPRRVSRAESDARNKLHSEYMQRLWRADGNLHPFFDRLASERIEARIAGVAPDGTLSLSLPDNSLRSYAFKEIEFLI